MKKILYLFALLMMSRGLALAQTAKTTFNAESGIAQLSFEIAFDKTSYLPFEPFLVRLKVSNQTDKVLAAGRPQFLNSSSIRVITPTGETDELGGLSLVSGTNPYLMPGPVPTFKPGESYQEESVPYLPADVLSKPGRYQIQFLLYGAVESNVVEIEILNPEGIDREAFEFLNEHGRYLWFGPFQEQKNPSHFLKKFAEQYETSGYGEYAILALGSYYHSTGNFDKAKALFEKLQSSKNRLIRTQSQTVMTEIQRKIEAKSKFNNP